ncbi:MAG: aldo/keto reductase, partial [Candidatus Latescibacterota bacterium]
KYLKGIPNDSRAAKSHSFLKPERITEENLAKIQKLNALAQERGQSLAQMAIAWVLRHNAVTTALVGASRPEQIENSVGVINNLTFSDDELDQIENIL